MIQSRLPLKSILIATAVIIGCDNSLEPIAERQKNKYSIYGTLNVSKNINYIRVHDTSEPINSNDPKELSLVAFLDNQITTTREVLTGQNVRFEDIYTQNFLIGSVIEYGTEYVFSLQDETGYKDSIQVFTPPKARAVLVNPEGDCDQVKISLEVSPVDFEQDEFVEVGLSFIFNGKEFFHGDGYGRNNDGFEIIRTDSVYSVAFWPNNVINPAIGIRPGPGNDAERITCIEEDITLLKLKYFHYGKPGFGIKNSIIDDQLVSVNNKKVLGLYEEEFELLLDTTRN